jgi:hypothetical protein
MEQELLQKLAEKTLAKKELFKVVSTDFGLLPQLISGLQSSKASVRYGCGSVLMDLSAKYPQKLYPHFDAFAALLDSKHRILVWNGLAIIANLCVVDKKGKFDTLYDKYYGFLGNEYMITVANVVDNSAKIALAKPNLTPQITQALLGVENLHTTPHLTEECKRVIAEKAVEAFSQFYSKMAPKEKASVVAFVKRQVGSCRETLSLQAEAFLKSHQYV